MILINTCNRSQTGRRHHSLTQFPACSDEPPSLMLNPFQLVYHHYEHAFGHCLRRKVHSQDSKHSLAASVTLMAPPLAPFIFISTCISFRVTAAVAASAKDFPL